MIRPSALIAILNLSVFSAFSSEYFEYKADGSFESLDSDGDGFISLNELKDELLSKDKFYQEDRRHRDLIDEQEVKKDIKDYIDKNFGGDTGKAFDSFDNKPKDGKLDKGELTAALEKIAKAKDKSYWPLTGTIANKIIKKCDKEPCDDKLTKEELEAATKGGEYASYLESILLIDFYLLFLFEFGKIHILLLGMETILVITEHVISCWFTIHSLGMAKA